MVLGVPEGPPRPFHRPGHLVSPEDSDASDLDLLVDLNEDVGLLGLIGLESDLAELLGRRVDVVPGANLKDAVAAQAFVEAVPL